MKKKILALAIGGVLSAGAQAALSDIIITEYVEGGGNNKAVELTNTTGTPYAFADTDVITYSSYTNTIYSSAKESVLKGITIDANETIVIVNGEVSADLLTAISNNNARHFVAGTYDQVSHNAMNFNGDDHVALRDNGTVVDIIGVDGSYWGSDQTLIRRAAADGSSLPTPDAKYVPTNWAESIPDGETVSKDNFTDLGLPTLKDYVEPPSIVELTMIDDDNGSFANTLARHVGQEVTIPADMNPTESGEQGLIVTRTYGFNFNNYSNNITAAYDRANYQPNQIHVAGSDEAKAYFDENIDHTLLITGAYAPDGELAYYPDFNTDPANNYIRIQDQIVGMTGMITGSAGNYTLTVTEDVDNSNFIHHSDRGDVDLDTSTAETAFAIKVATQNVLNLFNSPFGGDQNLHADNRGAETDAEYPRQKAKLVEAIFGLDADIIGLMEIENNGFGENGTIAEFVEAINEKYFIVRDDLKDDPNSETNRYVFIGFDSNGDTVLDNLDSVGSDAITSGIIYRPTKVSVENTRIIKMPEQHAPTIVNDNNVVVKDKQDEVLESGDNYQRNTVAATFTINNTGKRLTVAVNHLKSKGSTCYEDWEGVDFGTDENYYDKAPDLDFQGQCENFRVAAAVQIGEELEKIGGDRIVLGDMNSYAKEDPMLVLTSNPTKKVLTTARDTFIGKTPQFNTAGEPVKITKSYGYISAVDKKDKEQGKISWSYSYNDEIGSLDHVLITPSLNSRLIDAKDWHINAAESAYYDYNIVRFDSDDGLVPAKGNEATADRFYAEDAFRSSDHDSAIISLSYQYAETENNAPVLVTVSSGTMEVPYVLPASADVQAGDMAKISLKATNDDADTSDAILPQYAMSADQVFAKFEVAGITAGSYTATMTLERDGVTVADSAVSLKLDATKKDSLTPKLTVPESDGSGGSFGIFGILSLLGLGFLRRKL